MANDNQTKVSGIQILYHFNNGQNCPVFGWQLNLDYTKTAQISHAIVSSIQMVETLEYTTQK